MYQKISRDLKKLKNPEKIKVYQWFFKTDKGQYGEGDVFLGLSSAETKGIAKKYFAEADFETIKKLLYSKIHEERMCALRILVLKYEKSLRDLSTQPRSAQDDKKEIFDFYIKNAKQINNWDLVDVSAPNIVGNYLLDKDRKILYKLANSKNLWEKRISIISTFVFIRNNQFEDTLKISEILLGDTHDLLHKAVGWMLREVGKRDQKILEKFLDKNIKKLPRTTLRYAIEKFQEKKRKEYLKK